MELCRECKYFTPVLEFWGFCRKMEKKLGECEDCEDWVEVEDED